MSSPSRTERSHKTLAAIIAFGALLGGCSDIYYDRRETVALGADDHIASNRVAQMVDPWPVYVGDKNIAFNGQRMQAAVERYRYGKIIPPVNATTTSMTHSAGISSGRQRQHRHQPDHHAGRARRAGQIGNGQRALRRSRIVSRCHENWPVQQSSEEDPGGRAHRRRGVRGAGTPDFRRQRPDRAAGRVRLACGNRRGLRDRGRDRRGHRPRRQPAGGNAGARAADGTCRAWPPVVVVTQAFDENVARALVQMRVADFLVKPVSPVELVRTCARVAKGPAATPRPPRRRSTPSCPRSAAPA